MTDTDKPAPKKVNEKETNQPSHTKTVLKPAAKKVQRRLEFTRMNTALVKCLCNLPRDSRGGWCFIHNKLIPAQGKRDELIAATQADVEDEIIDSSEAPAAPVPAKKQKKAAVTAQEFPEEDSTVFKWEDIQIGKRYKCMSFGNKERRRTQKLLVPIDDF